MGIQDSDTGIWKNHKCTEKPCGFVGHLTVYAHSEVPEYEATEMPSRTQVTCFLQSLKQMRSAKFYFLVSCMSFFFSLLWVQFAIWQDQPAVNEKRIQAGLENAGRAFRYKDVDRKTDKLPKYFKYILLWTPSNQAPLNYLGNGQRAFLQNNCSKVNCYVTENRTFFGGNLTKFDAIAFNGRYMKRSDLPRIRSRHQKYIYFNMESADNFPVCSDKFDGFFNWTATYRLDSDVPIPYILIRDRKGDIMGPNREVRWMDNMEPVIDEFDKSIKNKSKAAAWFASRCKTRNDRRGFVEALKTALLPYRLTVDVYGACGTRNCSRAEGSRLLKRDYFFYMSLENSFSEDYVSEKLLTALQNNVVPIVYGAADYSRFLPPGSYIDGQAQRIDHLAGIMDALMHSPKEYSIQDSDTGIWKNTNALRSRIHNEVPEFEATEMPSRTQVTCLLQFVRQMRSVKFYFLVTCTSFVFSFLWLQLAIWQDQSAFNEILVQEALENAGRAFRYKDFDIKTDKLPKYLKYILLWTPSDYALGNGQRAFLKNNCPMVNCYVTANRSFFGDNLTKFDAIAFNGRNMNLSDLPSVRSRHQKYIYFDMESADNYPICSKKFDGFFNWTSTYRLDSDVPFPYILIRDTKGDIVGPSREVRWMDNMEPVRNEFDKRIECKSKAAAWFVSHCTTRSDRRSFVELLKTALMRYGLTVDIYGACGTLNCSRNEGPDLLKKHYFFYMSLENSLSEDYVTEKLLTAVQNNVVPIVYGGADYSRFLPPGSYINVLAQSIDNLAGIMNALIHSPKEYSQYFRWKRYYTYHDPSEIENVCALCEALHNTKMIHKTTIYDKFRYWWNPNYRTRCGLNLVYNFMKNYSKLLRIKQKLPNIARWG